MVPVFGAVRTAAPRLALEDADLLMAGLTLVFVAMVL
jgi:hypothetical protein